MPIVSGLIVAALTITSAIVEAGMESADTKKAIAQEDKLFKKSKQDYYAKQSMSDALAAKKLQAGRKALAHKRRMHTVEERDLADKQQKIKDDIQHREVSSLGSLLQPDEDRLKMKQNHTARWGV